MENGDTLNLTLPATGKTLLVQSSTGADTGTCVPVNVLAYWSEAFVPVDPTHGLPTVLADGALATLGAKADAKSAATDTTAITAMQVIKQLSDYLKAASRMIVAAASAVTRPADTTPYTAGDAVANHGTAGSVTPCSFTLSDTNDAPIAIQRARLLSSDTAPGAIGATFKLYLFRASPTVGAGDNAAFVFPQAGFLGSMIGVFEPASDGSVAILQPEYGSQIIALPTSGGATVFGLLRTLTGYTPSANSTTFTPTIEAVQGRA